MQLNVTQSALSDGSEDSSNQPPRFFRPSDPFTSTDSRRLADLSRLDSEIKVSRRNCPHFMLTIHYDLFLPPALPFISLFYHFYASLMPGVSRSFLYRLFIFPTLSSLSHLYSSSIHTLSLQPVSWRERESVTGEDEWERKEEASKTLCRELRINTPNY